MALVRLRLITFVCEASQFSKREQPKLPKRPVAVRDRQVDRPQPSQKCDAFTQSLGGYLRIKQARARDHLANPYVEASVQEHNNSEVNGFASSRVRRQAQHSEFK